MHTILILTAIAASVTAVYNQQAVWARSVIPHHIEVPIREPLPRIHATELDNKDNQQYQQRIEPFILTGAMDNWPALQKWIVGKDREEYLTNLFPEAVTDFYPYNMLRSGTHPHLVRFRRALSELLEPSSTFNDQSREFQCEEGCRYLHLQLDPTMWKTLEVLGDIPLKRHKHMKGDEWWMRRCLTDPDVRQEYFLKTHWKIILIGSRGAGMFNHSDSLMTSSWHGHIQGRKWWYVCSPQGVSPQRCYESVLEPGEILYYGSGWYHATRNLDKASMTLTGTIVHQYNYMLIAGRLHSECSRAALSFDFSARLCDALDKCFDIWSDYLGNTKNTLPKWRDVASDEEIEIKEARIPSENNYDGRNYIFEN